MKASSGLSENMPHSHTERQTQEMMVMYVDESHKHTPMVKPGASADHFFRDQSGVHSAPSFQPPFFPGDSQAHHRTHLLKFRLRNWLSVCFSMPRLITPWNLRSDWESHGADQPGPNSKPTLILSVLIYNYMEQYH